jgi:DNA-binding CsgD family transcriptional regulator
MTSGSLDSADVRSLLRLLGELRELGRSPPRWRRHLVDSLGKLCGARAVLAGELAVVGPGNGRDSMKVIHRELRGISAGDQIRFDEQVVWQTHGPNDAISGQWPRYGLRFTTGRQHLVDSRRWYRSAVANDQFRSFDCDDFIVSMVPVPALRAITAIKMFRAWRDRPFGERDGLLLDLLAEELARDWAQVGAAAGEARLGRRLRQVLNLLASGASEKEVGAALELSTHTVHDYIKALYRAFAVHSRPELLARIARPQALRTYLVSEAP